MFTRRLIAAHGGRCGFTLIEVLTVLAVIAVLAALLLPAYGVALRNARMAPCLSNLHQIGMAVKMAGRG